MKIQINSLAALERLIGGDTEVEIEVRDSIVQNFSKKHLKTVAQALIESGINEDIKRQMISEGLMSATGFNYSTIILGAKTQELIKDKTKSHMNNLVIAEVEKYLDEHEELKKFKETLERASERIVDSLTDGNLTARLDKLVDARLKERLGMS